MKVLKVMLPNYLRVMVKDHRINFAKKFSPSNLRNQVGPNGSAPTPQPPDHPVVEIQRPPTLRMASTVSSSLCFRHLRPKPAARACADHRGDHQRASAELEAATAKQPNHGQPDQRKGHRHHNDPEGDLSAVRTLSSPLKICAVKSCMWSGNRKVAHPTGVALGSCDSLPFAARPGCAAFCCARAPLSAPPSPMLRPPAQNRRPSLAGNASRRCGACCPATTVTTWIGYSFASSVSRPGKRRWRARSNRPASGDESAMMLPFVVRAGQGRTGERQ